MLTVKAHPQAADDINDVMREMIDLAKKLQCWIRVEIHAINVYAHPETSLEVLKERFEHSEKMGWPIAVARRVTQSTESEKR